MKILSLISFFLVTIASSIGLVSLPGCASIFPPEGGYRDSLPPVLLKATPPDSSNNFSEKRITLTFDEFVDAQNVRENLIVSPVPKTDPVVETRLRTVVVRLKDSLEPNTTYTLNFGNAIKDINEGNIARNFTYIFSTGLTFDSLTLSGKVLLARNGKIDTTLVVMLHTNGDDSAVINEKPRFLTRLDSTGNFHFRNLPPGTFYVYALQDEGGGHRYLSGKQLFAFADSSVTLQDNNSPITLYAYAEEPTTAATVPKIATRPRPGANNTDKRLKIQTNLASNELDLLTNLTMSFEQPLKKLDTSLIHFSVDSLYSPVTDARFLTDTSLKKVTLQYAWKENSLYHLILEKDFAVDTMDRMLLRNDTITFRTKKLSDYGSLRIRFKGLDLSVNPVLLFIQNDAVMQTFPLTGAEINQAVFLPGDYELRILFDRNKNGKWDAGEFFGKHVQPEIIKPVGRHVTVKPNWQNEFDIKL